jgi:hypothetical protein
VNGKDALTELKKKLSLKHSGVGPDDTAMQGYVSMNGKQYVTAQPTIRRVSISDADAAALRSVGPIKTALEIGTGYGVSTVALAEAAEVVVTIDTDPWVKKHVAPLLPAGVIFASDRSDVPTFNADLIHIDGDHETESVLDDISFCLDFCHPGTVWAFHDTKRNKVRKAISEAAIFKPIHVMHKSEAGISLYRTLGNDE